MVQGNPSLIVPFMLFCKEVTVDLLMFSHISLTVCFFFQAGTRKDMSVLMPDFSCPLVHLDAFLVSVQSSFFRH